MSSKRRSCRSKKSVDYVGNCGTKHDKNGSDDDFEKDFEPPSKRPKVKLCQDVENESRKLRNERDSPKERLSVHDKLYQRNVEKAIQRSLDSCPSSSSQDENSEEKRACKRMEKEVIADSSPGVKQLSQSSSKTSSQDKRKNKDEDDDYDPEQQDKSESSDEDSSDDIEHENDSDFDGKENNRNKSASARKKKISVKMKSPKNEAKPLNGNKKVNHTSKPTSNAKIDNQKISLTSIPSENRPFIVPRKKVLPSVLPSKSPINAATNKTSSFGLGGVVIKNPGPPIRVGLSRNIRVKPLHPKVSVTH